MVPPNHGNSVERGGQCGAHTEVMVEIAKIQSEVGHMRSNFDSVTEACAKLAARIEALAEKVQALSEKIQAPEVTKTWLVGMFSLVGGGISVLVAINANADKLAKLVGIGG